jgi:hypothetical protein
LKRDSILGFPVCIREGLSLPPEGSYIEVCGKFIHLSMEGPSIYVSATSWHYASVAYDFIKIIMLFSE